MITAKREPKASEASASGQITCLDQVCGHLVCKLLYMLASNGVQMVAHAES